MTATTTQAQLTTVMRRTLSAQGAMSVLDAAHRKAAEMGVPVVICVVDASGDLQAFVRMDGTPRGAVQWSIDKAVTAASFRAPTQALGEAMQAAPAPALASFIAQPHVTLAPAGIPLVFDGEVVGAIGASGGSPEQDQAIAEAGVSGLR